MSEPETDSATPADEPDLAPAARDEAPARRFPSRRLKLGAALVTLVVLGVGLPYYLLTRGRVSTDDAFVDGHMVAISPRVAGRVAEVHVADNQWVEAGAPLVTLDPADLAAAVARAEADLAGAKTQVTAAETNVEVTGTTTRAAVAEAVANERLARQQIDTAKARVASARGKVEQAEAGVRQAAALVDQARAELASAEAVAKRDTEDLERARRLLEAHSGTEQEVQHAVAAERAAKAEVEASRQRVRVAEAAAARAKTAVGVAKGDLAEERSKLAEAQAEAAAAKARLDSARASPYRLKLARGLVRTVQARVEASTAALKEARLKLSYTRIVAPVSGWVTRKSVEAGEYVQPGQALLVVVPPEVWVTANFKETQLTRMRPGQRATVTADAFPGLSLAAHVDGIQAGTGAKFSLLPPQNATGNFVKVVQRVPVKVVLDEPPAKARLVPGLSVIVDVDLDSEARPGAGARGATSAAASPVGSRARGAK